MIGWIFNKSVYNNLHVQVMTWWESFSIFNLYNSMHLIKLSHHPRLILWSYHIIEYERDLIHIKIPYHIVIWCAYYDHYDRITTLKMTKGPHTYHYHITISYYHMYHIKILSYYDYLKLTKGPDAPLARADWVSCHNIIISFGHIVLSYYHIMIIWIWNW